MAKETEPGLFFFASWRETLKELFPDAEARAEAYDSIIDYAITGVEPVIKNPMVKVFFSMAKGLLDAKESKRGPGAPEGNQNAAKSKKKQSESIENNSKQLKTIDSIENNSEELKQMRPDSIYESESDSFFNRDRDEYRDEDENRDRKQGQGAAASNDKESRQAAAAFEAEIQQEESEQLFNEVIKSFTASGVFLTRSSFDELRGFFDYGMEPEVLAEAAKRAADAGKATWKYTRGILQSWAKAKVLTLEDVRREDASYARKKAAAVASKNHSGDRPPASAYAPIYDGGDSGISGYIGRDDDISAYKTGGIS